MTSDAPVISAPAGKVVIRLAGAWPPERLRIQIVPSTWAVPASVQQQIDFTWDIVARSGINLFDGPMCRLEAFRATPAELSLTISETTYRIFVGTNLRHPELADTYGPSVLANSIGVSVLVRTADGFILLGRRNESVVYWPSRLHPFAGAMEPADESNPFIAAKRELHEEAGLVESDISGLRCVGIVSDHFLRQPEMVLRAQTRLNRSQIESQFGREEHHDVVAIEAGQTAIQSALRNPALTPVALGGLILWGRSEWGEAWMRDATANLARLTK
jgi:8-oxo-dGTP pyrophosphatase MutT (NUDIX family)